MAFATGCGAVIGFLVTYDALPVERAHIRRRACRGLKRMAIDARRAFARIVALDLAVASTMVALRTVINSGFFVVCVVIEPYRRPRGLDGFRALDLQQLGPCKTCGK